MLQRYIFIFKKDKSINIYAIYFLSLLIMGDIISPKENVKLNNNKTKIITRIASIWFIICNFVN